ncbi:unnamed protein product [Commensalibacter communis]|uniref:hypothetical protein n=1 Tax=Commensalibacter communis TaxID=2972786 RepID=UPI0022FF93E6|nr:hypothetical protein [Commensalibacter communis]CAI3953849.1 unnamed protein product [Commensalibacter communis]CAI3958999.1 unnamed protein product [Commensalibacter communis]
MTKIENNGQVVKKEVFKIIVCNTKKIIEDEFDILSEYSQEVLCILLTIKKNLRKDYNEELQISFEELCHYSDEDFISVTLLSLSDVRKSAQQLEAKGYLIRDKDGFLMLAQRDV